MANVRFYTPASLSARTANSNSTSVSTVLQNYGDVVRSIAKKASIQLRTTAKTGTTPTLTVLLQGSDDDSAWVTVGSMTVVNDTAVSTEHKVFDGPMPKYLRVAWTFGGSGTPGYTFEVKMALEE